MESEKVVLVNESDEVVGQMNKMEAHEKGLLHRAFSVFIFNDSNELLIHQRADEKYHSGGLWTNTCCSHPRYGEEIIEAGKRRLQEEMGFVTELHEQFSFIYRAELDHNLIEHELDHVLFGTHNEISDFNPMEVKAAKFIKIDELEMDIKLNPNDYTEWFKIIFEMTKKLTTLAAK